MNALAETYQLDTFSGLLNHFPQRLTWVRDIADEQDFDDTTMLWRARVRSGDYLMTLATELDKLAQAIASTDDIEAAHLERLVSELLYINRYFEITKKD